MNTITVITDFSTIKFDIDILNATFVTVNVENNFGITI